MSRRISLESLPTLLQWFFTEGWFLRVCGTSSIAASTITSEYNQINRIRIEILNLFHSILMEDENQYLVKIISVGWIVLNKKNIERIATERIEILIDNALNEINRDEKLSQTYAKLALKIGMRVRVRMPYSIRQLFCRKCKQFIVPGVNSRIRIGRTRVKYIRITCMKCNHVYRKIIAD